MDGPDAIKTCATWCYFDFGVVGIVKVILCTIFAHKFNVDMNRHYKLQQTYPCDLESIAVKQVAAAHPHYNDVVMGIMVSQITSLAIVYSNVYSRADQRKHQSSAPLAFVRGIHRWPVNSLHKWPVMRKIFPFDDVIVPIRTFLWNSETTNYITKKFGSFRHTVVALTGLVWGKYKCILIYFEFRSKFKFSWQPTDYVGKSIGIHHSHTLKFAVYFATKHFSSEICTIIACHCLNYICLFNVCQYRLVLI